MTLSQAIHSYVTLKRSMGAVFSGDTRILRSFGRLLGDVPVEAIDRDRCHAFCRGIGSPTRFWERKHYVLRGLFRYLIARGHLQVSPLPERGPRIQRSFQSYIYSLDEVRRLLDATSILQSQRSPWKPLIFRTLLLVLYAAGLRPSEGRRLRICDVDLDGGVLAIWDTKFFKSRVVPVGRDLKKALDTYLQVRLARLPSPDGVGSPFFCTRTGEVISLARLEAAFVRLRKHAGVQRPPTDRWQPRLHDLRHAFAHDRLVAWYREGADVQACLPLLATYLGHINLSGTQTYLSMTAELLAEASQRFERYAGASQESGHA